MRKKSRLQVTLKDIAKATGYSVNTVSRSLRGKDDIAAETRDIIKQTANQMGYINNALASSLRSGNSNSLAVILGDVSNPHFGIMMKEIENSARNYGYTSFLLNTNENEQLEKAAIETALNKNVDGVIICPTQQSKKNIKFLMEYGLPFVQIGRYFSDIEANYVVCNDELGGYQATKYLLESGHRNIAILSGPHYISSARERLAGFKRAHQEMGVPIKSALIKEVPITADECINAIDALIEQDEKFTALFAFSDMIAWQAWSRLRYHGLSIPEDCSLIGFDNIQSRLVIPHRLNSISTYKAMMSTTAVDCLMCKIHSDEAKHPECNGKCFQIIDTQLADGETVRAIENN